MGSLDPEGPVAEAIADLWWLMLALGAAVFVVFAVLLAVGLLRRPAKDTDPGRAESELVRRWIIPGGVVMPLVVLIVVFGATIAAMRFVPTTAPPEALVIEVVGHQFWWEVRYPQEGITTTNELHIPVGQPVAFELTSADVIHSFWVPSLAGKIDMIPGRTTHLRMKADHAGVFRGQCAEYCGGPHALMAFEVVAMPPDEFETWLQQQAAPAAAPTAENAQRGLDLFLAAGCGSCHTVRGTAAAGTIGPDLTHLGSRRSVGIDTAAMTEDNVARFIRDGQHVKPGNRMPPFRVFAPADLAAVSAYLTGLR